MYSIRMVVAVANQLLSHELEEQERNSGSVKHMKNRAHETHVCVPLEKEFSSVFSSHKRIDRARLQSNGQGQAARMSWCGNRGVRSPFPARHPSGYPAPDARRAGPDSPRDRVQPAGARPEETQRCAGTKVLGTSPDRHDSHHRRLPAAYDTC
jgi:hypothetical protein